jgi:LysM repeat protein
MNRRAWLVATITAASLLAGCVRFPEPNPEPMPGEAAPGAAAQTPATGLPSGSIYTVQSGDNVFALAERYRIPLRSLIDNNRLQPPYRLVPGQPLFIPKPREHRVAQGDTVYGISRRYRVDMSALVKFNQIVPPYTIHVGQVLRIPAPVENESTLAATAPAAPDATAPAPQETSAPVGRGRFAIFDPAGGSSATCYGGHRLDPLAGYSNAQTGDAGGWGRPGTAAESKLTLPLAGEREDYFELRSKERRAPQRRHQHRRSARRAGPRRRERNRCLCRE